MLNWFRRTEDLEPVTPQNYQDLEAAIHRAFHDVAQKVMPDPEALTLAIEDLQRIQRLALDCRNIKVAIESGQVPNDLSFGMMNVTNLEALQALVDGLQYRVKVLLSEFEMPNLDYRDLCTPKPGALPSLGDVVTIETVAEEIDANARS